MKIYTIRLLNRLYSRITKTDNIGFYDFSEKVQSVCKYKSSEDEINKLYIDCIESSIFYDEDGLSQVFIII